MSRCIYACAHTAGSNNRDFNHTGQLLCRPFSVNTQSTLHGPDFISEDSITSDWNRWEFGDANGWLMLVLHPFIRDVSILGLWYPPGSWNQFPLLPKDDLVLRE